MKASKRTIILKLNLDGYYVLFKYKIAATSKYYTVRSNASNCHLIVISVNAFFIDHTAIFLTTTYLQ